MSCCGGRGGSGSKCTCKVVAGDGITVTGNGSSASPYKIEGKGGGGKADCETIRGCISAEGPATFDPKTGKIGVQLSKDEGNQVKKGNDGGLFVPKTSTANAEELTLEDWPHSCPPDQVIEFANHSGGKSSVNAFDPVYKTKDGGLFTDTGIITQSHNVLDGLNEAKAGREKGDLVPEAERWNKDDPSKSIALIATPKIKIKNPDECRKSRVVMDVEVSVEFDLPSGASAVVFHGESRLEPVWASQNAGVGEEKKTYMQVNRTYFHYALNPGEEKVFDFVVGVGRGSNGARWKACEWKIKAMSIIGVDTLGHDHQPADNSISKQPVG